MTRTGPQGRSQPSQTAPIGALLSSPPDLPVVEVLPELRERLRPAPSGSDNVAPCLVLTAPPGTGKTTLVPPLLADVLTNVAAAPQRTRERGPGRIVVTQPRRIAARAAARRLADLLGEEVGTTVGYAVRGERRAGPDTRIEVVTAGLLLRRLQRDPELSGIDAVILDEVHERSLDSDLLLALPGDARAPCARTSLSWPCPPRSTPTACGASWAARRRVPRASPRWWRCPATSIHSKRCGRRRGAPVAWGRAGCRGNSSPTSPPPWNGR